MRLSLAVCSELGCSHLTFLKKGNYFYKVCELGKKEPRYLKKCPLEG